MPNLLFKMISSQSGMKELQFSIFLPIKIVPTENIFFRGSIVLILDLNNQRYLSFMHPNSMNLNFI